MLDISLASMHFFSIASERLVFIKCASHPPQLL